MSVFKKTAKPRSRSLKVLFDNIKRLKIFPKAWKKAVILPIFKDGNRAELSNY